MTQSPEAALADEIEMAIRAIQDAGDRAEVDGATDTLGCIAFNNSHAILAALRAKPAGDVEQNPLWPFAIHAPIFKGDADRDVADLAGHSLLVSDFRRASAALAQLPADQPDIADLVREAVACFNALSPEEQRAHRHAQRESWVRGMTTPCEHGELDFEQCPQCRAPTQAIDIGSTMPDPFFKTGEDIGGLKRCAHCNAAARRSMAVTDDPIRYAIGCSQCPITTDWLDDEAEAIAAWNTRKENGRG